MRRHGMHVTLKEAEELLRRYGCCYPMRPGLTRWGRKQCARIRSALRRSGKPVDEFEIRLIVYEDGYFIKPKRQKPPYQHAAARLRKWQAEQRRLKAQKLTTGN